ncbi:hypothetical protein ACX80L_08745 [Arthrobacter sp. MDT1-48-3]
MDSRISPDEPFPPDLGRLRTEDVEILNSKVHREIEHEFAADGEIDAETASRKDELTEELDDREAGPRLTLVPHQAEGDEAPSGDGHTGSDTAARQEGGISAGAAPGRSWYDAERQ